ncbi:hypothetical protein BU15DRAFT_82245 [Melanogaster broomeanus]|nr:hypothetical protein BU15DRAFT_82245 [Melanogaster broomeanus]
MSDLPSQFFMKHVALRQRDWRKAKVYEALFDYCFPPDFKMRLRQELTMARQSKDTKVRDFVRNLESLCVRFPEVSHSQLVQIFWDGMHTYLRVHLLEQGLKPDRSTLMEMVEAASRKEEAVDMARRERLEGFRNSYTSGDQRFMSRTMGVKANETYEAGNECLGRDGWQSDDADSGDETNPSRLRADDLEGDAEWERPQWQALTSEELVGLRMAGKCFNCKEVGHKSRDCPRRNTAGSPRHIRSSAARFVDIDDLPAEGMALRVSVVRIGGRPTYEWNHQDGVRSGPVPDGLSRSRAHKRSRGWSDNAGHQHCCESGHHAPIMCTMAACYIENVLPEPIIPVDQLNGVDTQDEGVDRPDFEIGNDKGRTILHDRTTEADANQIMSAEESDGGCEIPVFETADDGRLILCGETLHSAEQCGTGQTFRESLLCKLGGRM